MNERNELLTVNYWEIVKRISVQNDISLRKAVEKYYEISGLPSQEVYENILNYLSQNSKPEPDVIFEEIIASYKEKYEIDFKSPYVRAAHDVYYKFLLNIYNINEEGIEIDGRILSEFIFLKYGGEDMTDVVKQILQNVCKRNRSLPHSDGLATIIHIPVYGSTHCVDFITILFLSSLISGKSYKSELSKI